MNPEMDTDFETKKCLEWKTESNFKTFREIFMMPLFIYLQTLTRATTEGGE